MSHDSQIILATMAASAFHIVVGFLLGWSFHRDKLRHQHRVENLRLTAGANVPSNPAL